MFSLANPVDQTVTLTKHNIMSDDPIINEPISQMRDEFRGLGYAKYCGKNALYVGGEKTGRHLPPDGFTVIARGSPRESH